MAEDKKDEGPGNFEQDPFVERLRPEPSAPPAEVATLEGLAGKSDRDGWARIYFNTTLTFYAEFKREDIVYTEAIAADQPPMKGLKCTRVGVKKDAVIEFTRSVRARPADELDLDVRLAAARQNLAPQEPDTFGQCPATIGIECPTQPFGCVTDQTCGCGTGRTDCFCPTVDTCGKTICIGQTCIDVCDTNNTCVTVCGNTCQTCQTRCNQPTCQGTCRTCQTRCNQATCNTCQTRCGQVTCNTCRTRCDQATCDTCSIRCPTNNPHVFTCGPQCLEP